MHNWGTIGSQMADLISSVLIQERDRRRWRKERQNLRQQHQHQQQQQQQQQQQHHGIGPTVAEETARYFYSIFCKCVRFFWISPFRLLLKKSDSTPVAPGEILFRTCYFNAVSCFWKKRRRKRGGGRYAGLLQSL